MECFYPRVGGIIYITTKSKKFLSNIKREYKQNIEENKKRKKDGEIYIR
jgi:LysM repeat protein